MDTNLTNLLTEIIRHQTGNSSGYTNLLTAGLILLAAVAPTLVSLAAFLRAGAMKANSEEAKLSSAEAAKSSADTAKSAADTADSMKAIHVAVNSERSAMLEKIEKLRDEVLSLSEEKAATVERTRSREVQEEIAHQTQATGKPAQTVVSSTETKTP